MFSRRYPSTDDRLFASAFCCTWRSFGLFCLQMTVYLHRRSVAIAEVLACFVALTVKLALERRFWGPRTSSSPWNGGFGRPWTSSRPWNGRFRNPWTSSWPWNRGFGYLWTSSWPWTGGTWPWAVLGHLSEGLLDRFGAKRLSRCLCRPEALNGNFWID